jgi:hypothetical protein
MNKENDWHDLIQKHLAGNASSEESLTLEKALEKDADLRRLYLDYANLDMALGASAEAAKALQEVPMVSRPKPRPSLFSLRPLTSVAAGIVLGVLTTSVLWAYAVPSLPKETRIKIPLVAPGFEEVATPLPATPPRSLNRWNGDASHTLSSGDSTVKPKKGRFMLKMQPVEDRRFSRLEQIIDVRHLVPAEGGVVKYSAWFSCDGAVTQSKMLLVLRAFTLSPEEINGSTENLVDQVTSEARKAVFIPAGSTDWHRGVVRMDLPENTKTLVFSIVAFDPPEASKGSSRYLDEVKATIVVSKTKEETL